MATLQPQTVNLSVNGQVFQGFHDFGPSLSREFQNLYSLFIGGSVRINANFIAESEKIFDQIDDAYLIEYSDDYFENFTYLTNSLLNNFQYELAFSLWSQVLKFVSEWEERSSRKLHKGTPYYFAGMAAILQHDFDSGLMAMHKGLLEDKANNPNWELTPGYYFMSLNEQATAQAFKPFVDGMIKFLRRRLDTDSNSYVQTNKGIITYNELRVAFLDNTSVPEDIRFYFVYALIRVWHLRRLHKSKMGDSLMAPLIYSNAIFDLLLVLDELLKRWDNPQGSRQYFSGHYDKLAKKEGWHDLGQHNANKRRDDDFIKWCTELLDGSYRTQTGESTSLLERDFIFAYGLRNLSAHSIKSYELLWSNYTKVLQAVFNCIFKTVELIK